jgi:hypothetical protein
MYFYRSSPRLRRRSGGYGAAKARKREEVKPTAFV